MVLAMIGLNQQRSPQRTDGGRNSTDRSRTLRSRRPGCCYAAAYASRHACKINTMHTRVMQVAKSLLRRSIITRSQKNIAHGWEHKNPILKIKKKKEKNHARCVWPRGVPNGECLQSDGAGIMLNKKKKIISFLGKRNVRFS